MSDIHIGRITSHTVDRRSRFSSDVIFGAVKETIWFEIPEECGKYAVTDRCDAFVAGLIFSAVSYQMNIVSELPMSSNLYYQFNEHIIIQIAKVLGKKPIKLKVPLIAEKTESAAMVGTGYSRGADSFFSIMMHTKSHQTEEHHPYYRPELTHLVVMNNGVFEGDGADHIAEDLFEDARQLADKLGLKAIYINTNLQHVLHENFLEVVTFRNVSCVLLLQKLFSVYLYSSGHGFEDFSYTRKSTGEQELFICRYFSTPSLRFYASGAGFRRIDKIIALSEYEPCFDRLHPCFVSFDKNCGHCRKCRRDTVTLMAIGALDRFSQVYDVEFARKNFDINVAFLIANESKSLYREVLELLKEKGIKIPERSKMIAVQFRKGMTALTGGNGGNGS